jgi:signal transduction histidine kinase
MGWLSFVPFLILLILLCYFRFHLLSLYNYILARLELRRRDFRLLSSLRDDLVHERKKKTAGLEMILSSWERGDEVQPRYEYFEELVDQLKALIKAQRRNLMAVTRDLWLWAKLWNILRRIEKTAAEKREKSDVAKLRISLVRFQELLERTVEEATDRLSFTLNEILEESVKTVRMEKSELTGVAIRVELDQIGNTIRLSYDKSREWQRILTNLIRNAIEAVESKQSGAGSVVADLGLPGREAKYLSQAEGVGVAADFSLRGRRERYRVLVSTKEAESGSVSVIIQDSGIGMDEATRSSFYKKGFTLGKESGLGLGVTEESVDLINRFGSWKIDSKKGVGTKITINIDKEKARQAELFAPEEKRFSRAKLVLVLSVPLVIIIGLILLFVFDKYSRFWVDWNPMSAKVVDEKRVVAEAKDGRFLWVRSFQQKVRETCVVVADIDKDGRNEVLIGTMKASKETGNLFCFSYRGNELWRFALGADRIFQVTSNRYNCCSIIAQDLNSDGETEILAEATNTPWFPHQIALLDRKGLLQASYWHSGAIGFLLCEDVDDDEIQEIVFGGVNNRLQYSAVLGILAHDHNWGQSPPYRDTILAKAKETIYVKFPFVRGLGGKNDRYSNVIAFMYAGRENGSDVYHVTVIDEPGFQREYHLDEGLTHVKDVVVHPDYRFAWERMKREGMVDYDLSPEVIESWKEIEVWKNGVKVK